MGFSFGGIPSQSMGITARLTQWQVTPNINNSTVTIPGKPGLLDFGASIGERIISLSCNIKPKYNMTNLISAIDGISEWLGPEDGLQELILDDIPNRYCFARLSDRVDCEKLVLSSGAFPLNFICPDPFFYAITDEVFDISTVGTTTINRTIGNVKSEPVYSLKGTLTSSQSITITTNGITMKINGPLASSEILEIDSARLTAKVINSSGKTLRNGLPLIENLDFPLLKSGANSIQIVKSGGTFTLLTIKSNSRWR